MSLGIEVFKPLYYCIFFWPSFFCILVSAEVETLIWQKKKTWNACRYLVGRWSYIHISHINWCIFDHHSVIVTAIFHSLKLIQN